MPPVPTRRYPQPRYLDYPLAIDGSGRAALTLADDHVRDMIEQVLFTAPGERVMLPEFGCGLLKLVFEPNSDLLAAATELLVRGSLQRWLEYVIDVSSVKVRTDDSTLVVDVEYVRLVDGREVAVRIIAPGSAG
ncbi:MAG TPA: GPW/gp25 family protein [Solirubrobacteraceae bacterium]